MTDKKKENQTSFDIFIANSTFPDAKSLFATYIKPLEEIKKTALVVLDTNALLVPYSIGKESLSQIKETYKKLVKTEQLLVPGQVAREFVKNRTNKIAQLFQQLSRKQNSTHNLQTGKYPLLESLSDYEETIRLEKEIDKLLNEYKKAISNVLDHIRSWTWNDPVSLLYAELFTKEVVFDLALNKEEQEKLQEELSRRQLHHIPPGYKDSNKEDSGIGDLLIWFTILEVGKSRKKDVIFVSNDQKPDWWYQSEKQALYPRYELVDEFRRESDGFSLHILPFSRFLDLYGASESVVEEVREEENRLSLEFGLIGEFVHKWQILEQVLLSKYRALNPSIPTKWLSPILIVEMLYKRGLIDRDLVSGIHELNKIKNVLLHESSANTLTNLEMKSMIASVDEMIETVDQLPSDEPG
jgi:exonuclease VII small subunit